jgi:hypothetical protein
MKQESIPLQTQDFNPPTIPGLPLLPSTSAATATTGCPESTVDATSATSTKVDDDDPSADGLSLFIHVTHSNEEGKSILQQTSGNTLFEHR